MRGASSNWGVLDAQGPLFQMPALWAPRPGTGRTFLACFVPPMAPLPPPGGVPCGVGTVCYSSPGRWSPWHTVFQRPVRACSGLGPVDRVGTPVPRPSDLAGPCRGQPHSAGGPAQQTLRWPGITGTHGRVQAPLGALQMV